MITRVQSYFRSHAGNIGLVIIALAFMAILALQAVATNQLQTEVETQQQIVTQTKEIADATHTILTRLDKNATQNTTQIAALQAHLDCIASLFAQSDRAVKSITNLDSCTITTAATGASTTAPVGSSTRAVPASTPKTSSTPQPTATPTPTPKPATQQTIIQRITNLLNLL